MRRKTPIQSRAKVTSEAILEAAEIIILKDGYDKATTNYIAERAGVSIGSLYQYFPNKDSLLSALIELKVSRLANGVRIILQESMDLPLADASRRILTYLLDNFREHKVLLYSLSKQTPELVELTRNLSVEKFTHATSRALFERHAGEITVKDLDRSLNILEIAVLSNIRRYILEEPADLTDEAFIDEMVRLSMGYMKAGDALYRPSAAEGAVPA
ncbi:TetR/AcrR family transcriptional regulator [Sphingomonas colocasiae]|uniref:TetR/AcrR family transcriptional regulator n=1 Tax=Sphingomonas colocasiae TaxID=1848973 RepID=A0ABS7PKF8_9SPHN|nr:TetR/AcrR family transcriptional regulator [Sphingomonas colocasiae]MBY8821772.1 TetR/AcrR family transcriptional regulator [Sphingomonas colocasiae]